MLVLVRRSFYFGVAALRLSNSLLSACATQDRSLETTILRIKNANRAIASDNPYETLQAYACSHGGVNENASFVAPHERLSAPPLAILLHPEHIVICSFLGKESAETLQWLIRPPRSPHASSHPPITILDTAEPSDLLTRMLLAFENVVCARVVRGRGSLLT